MPVKLNPHAYSNDETIRQLYKYVKGGCHFSDFKHEVQRFETDPTFDFAKLTLSSVCAYGIAYRHGFRIDAGRKKPTTFRLRHAQEDEMRRRSKAGGISGANIVLVDVPVPVDAWHYHRLAGTIVCRDFVRLLREVIGEDRRSINLGILRLWFLTVRHVFGVCGMLFPEDVLAAMSLYLVGTRLLNSGADAVKTLLDSNLEMEPEEAIQTIWDHD